MITTSNTEASVNHEKKLSTHSRSDAAAAEFAKRVRSTRQKLTSELKSHYDFIVCGSGSAGSVVPRRLAVNANISVLLLEAGGDDDIPSVMEANQWHLNIGSQRDWNFVAQPNSCLNGRVIPLDMGKVLRGGLRINLMCWARGHKNDWDFFACETGDKHGSFCWDSLWVWRGSRHRDRPTSRMPVRGETLPPHTMRAGVKFFPDGGAAYVRPPRVFFTAKLR